MKNNKKVIISSILGVIALCIITLSLTYAYWQINKNQTGENVVNTDCFNIEFVGENDINLPKAYPLKDEELEELITTETPYTFTITNRCSSLASATINMETVPIEGKKLDDEWIDVLLYDAVKNKPNSYLNKSKKLTGNLDNTENKVIETSEKAYALYNFTLKANEEKTFNLLIYMNQDTPASEENMNATWKGKITLSTSYKVDQFASAGTLRQINTSYDTKGMWEYKKNITKIVIENKLTEKEGTVVHGPFDESVDNSNSIQSYVVCEEEDTNCIGYLQGNGGIKLNEDSSYLFYNFSKVAEIEGIANLDTSSVTYMNQMFAFMSSLQNLNLGSNFDTSSVTNMESMFRNMSALEELNLGDKFDTSSVTNMDSMFNQMSALQSLDLSSYNFDTNNVTKMDGMFSSMSALKELNLGDKFDTSSVENMSSMFYWMRALQKLDLGKNFDTRNVKNMSYMFYMTDVLQNLNLGNKFDTSKVINMNHMFSSMRALKELNLGNNFDTSSVENMSFMFYGMKALQSLDLKNKFDTSKVINMSEMFDGMSALQSLDLSTSNFNTSNVENMKAMFGDDINLTTINYGSNFIHKEGAITSVMFGGSIDNVNYEDCPANRPDETVHPSWAGVSFAGN